MISVCISEEVSWIRFEVFGEGFINEISLFNLYFEWKVVFGCVEDFRNGVLGGMSNKIICLKRGMIKNCVGVDWKNDY